MRAPRGATALFALLCAARGVAAVPAPAVVCPQKLPLSSAPWAVAAFDLPAGADVALTLRPWATALSGGAVVASGAAVADASGAVTVTLALASGAPPPGLYTLHAASAAAAWRADANVTLVGAAPFLSIVLDKALYKPGETVLIRTLALTTDMLPSAGAQVNLTVRDPGGFAVAATSAVTDAFGMLAWSVPTSAEPTLGEWSVAASASSPAGASAAERSFELARYVLPTFSVSVTPSRSYLLAGAASVTGTLSALHTDGAPVVGTVLLSVFQPQAYYPFWSGGFVGGGRPAMVDAVQPVAAVSGGASSSASSGAAASGGANGALPVVSIATSSSSSSDAAGGGGGSGRGTRSATLLATLALATSADGSARFSVALPAAGVSWDGGALLVHAAVTETATGEARNGTASVPVSSSPLAASLAAPPSFRPGLPWRVTLALTRPDGTPAAGADAPSAAVAATASRRDGRAALDVTTAVRVNDATGAADVAFTVPADDPACCSRAPGAAWSAQSCCVDYVSVSLAGVPGVSAYAGASAADAGGATGYISLGPLSPAGPLPPGAAVAFTPAATSATAPVRWALLGPGGAVAAGAATPGVPVSVAVPAAAGTAPTLLAWYDTGAALAFDWATLSVDVSLPASLSASFGAPTAAPGDDVALAAAGSPACRVFFAATDTSVSLLGADAALTAAGVADAAAAAAADAADAAEAAATASGALVGACWSPPPHEAAGAAMLTALTLPSCQRGTFMPMPMMAGAALAAAAMPMADATAASATANRGNTGAAEASGSGGGSAAPRVRSQFPETWIWDVADADGAGAASLSATAPDTMTSWQLAAFSVHPTLGVAVAAPPSPLVVTRPFYVRAALPPALVRGERVLLRVGLFSNLSTSATATVTLLGASEAGFDVEDAAAASAALQPRSAGGVAFALTPRSLGLLTLRLTAVARDTSGALLASDALSTPLLVLAEGIPAEVTQNALLRVGADATAAEGTASLSAAPPANAVPGSARATLTVVGDIMGQTLAGLGALLQVPSGCGEQNMIGMAPNLAVLGYLAATPSAAPPPTLVATAVANAALGYQRELTYRHADGSFSAFGDSDASGSTWLTAFVLQIFSQAAAHVTVDTTVLASAATWLLATQSASGAFPSVGNVIHTELVGGTSSDVSLTGFVLAALLAAPPAAGVPSAALSRAAAFLAGKPAAGGDAYAAHLRAYALAAACASPLALRCADAAAAVNDIAARAVTTGPTGLKHWEEEVAASAATAAANVMYWQAPPANIELTGYGVQSLLAQGRVADAAAPARWLVAQRNGGGGFASTQDTVVGLAALARFAAATSSAPPSLTLRVSGAGVADGTSLSVDAPRASLLQQLAVPSPSAPLAVQASGSGTALVQLTTRYNALPSATSAAGSSGAAAAAGFAVSVAAANVTGGAPGRRRSLLADGAAAAPAPLVHQTVCAQRAGGASAARAAGMVIVEAGLFSGYVPIASSLEALRASAPALLKRVEVDLPGRRVLFYLDALAAGESVCLGFDTLQTDDVAGLAPAASRVYSYYAPADAGGAVLAPQAVSVVAQRPPSTVVLGGSVPGSNSGDAARRAARVWAALAGAAALMAAGRGAQHSF